MHLARILKSRKQIGVLEFVMGLILCSIPAVTKAVEGGFTNVTSLVGINHVHYKSDFEVTSEYQILTGGAAAGDFDGDGWIDLFVTRLDNTDILYRNLGGERNGSGPWFENVSSSAGFSQVDKTSGAAWGDIDNDGDLDLYLSVIEAPRFYLYVNNGDGTFTEQALARGVALNSGLDHNGYSVSFGDYDRDGWLDIHTCEWDIDTANPASSQHTVLLRNLGSIAPGFFRNVTAEAGVEFNHASEQYAFTSNFTDLDDDGWPDLAITGDFTNSRLFWNNGDGTFTDGTQAGGVNKGKNEMGVAIGDYDLDGRLDWWVTSTEFDNRLYRNLGNRQFSEEAGNLGVENGDWGWGTQLFDYDNDGDLDLIMTNGWHIFNEPESMSNFATPVYFWRNDGGNFTKLPAGQSGLRDEGEGKALVTFDYDKDGDQDVYIANNGGSPVLFRNDINAGNAWLRLRLSGTRSNTRGIGTRVRVVPSPGASTRIYELTGGGHYSGQSEAVVHVGLGSQPEPVHRVELLWPSGLQQVLTSVAVNQELVVVEPGYYAWIEEHFSASEQQESSVVGREEDPDRDGISNLFEYAFGLDPQMADQEAPVEFSPVNTQTNRWQIKYLRPKEGLDLSYFYEFSEDLQQWSPLEEFQEAVTLGDTFDEVELVFAKDSPCFVRIRVEML